MALRIFKTKEQYQREHPELYQNYTKKSIYNSNDQSPAGLKSRRLRSGKTTNPSNTTKVGMMTKLKLLFSRMFSGRRSNKMITT